MSLALRIPATFRRAAIAAALMPLFASAADAARIEGHVLRGKENRPLVGAAIVVRETGATVRSGPDGGYEFDDLAPGQYTLQVRAEGMDLVERNVDLRDGKSVKLDIPLDAALTALETVVVESQYVPNDVARAAQQEALNLVNLTTAEEIHKLPDVNAAEAVRRLPGISLETDTGEGRFINIRGLDADLNSTTFGGLRLPPSNPASPFSGGRAVAYDAIPTGLIGAITVTKSNLPEQDAEALGGTIEISPKTAPRSGRPFVEANVGTGREPLRHTNIKDYAVTAGTRFGGDGIALGSNPGMLAYKDLPFSIVVTGSYYADKRGIDDIEAGYFDQQPTLPDKAFSAFEQRYYQYDRKRHGIGIDLAYEPDARSKYYVRAFDAGYTETVNRQRLVWNFDGNTTVDPSNPNALVDSVNVGGWDKTLRDEKERTNNKVAAVGGQNQFDGYAVDYRLGYTRGSFDKYYDYNADFNYMPAVPTTVTYNNTSNPNYPSFRVSGANPHAWSNYTLINFQNSTESLSDHETSLVANLTIPTHLSSFEDERFKTGVSIRARQRRDIQPSYSFSGFPAIPLTAAGTGEQTFYGGRYDNGPNIDYNFLRALFLNGTAYAPSLNVTDTAQTATSGKENVYAVYGQYEFGVGKLGIVSGLRIEQTRARYDANAAIEDSNNNVTGVVPVTQSTSYTNLFPSMQGRLALREDLIGRVAFSSTIARPGFNQVDGAVVLQPSQDQVTEGNPNLKPTTAHSIDIALEQYLPYAGIVSVGIFDKEINDYIANVVTTQTFPNGGLFAGFVGPAHVITYANIPSSRAWGLEANYEQRYRKLPGLWSGLGTSMNWTYVDSEGQFRTGQEMPLPSTSRNTANAEVFYERDGLNVRLGAYYTSRNLFAFGGSTATDVYSEPRMSVDLGSSYNVVKNIGVYFNVKNLTNTPLKFTEGSDNRPIQREFYGPTYQLGLRFDY